MSTGRHLILDLYDCDKELLDDYDALAELLETALRMAGATILKMVGEKFQPQGVTLLFLLAESHASIHTWPEEGKAAVDLYTCGDSNPKLGCDMIIDHLYSTNHTLSYIER